MLRASAASSEGDVKGEDLVLDAISEVHQEVQALKEEVRPFSEISHRLFS